MTKLYIVTFNTDTNFDPLMFYNHITSLYPTYISDWAHYLFSSYLIASSFNVNQLYSAIYTGIPGKYLLITEIDPNNAQGWLPKDAWVWLQKYQHKKV
jgi:hypothetical protein